MLFTQAVVVVKRCFPIPLCQHLAIFIPFRADFTPLKGPWSSMEVLSCVELHPIFIPPLNITVYGAIAI